MRLRERIRDIGRPGIGFSSPSIEGNIRAHRLQDRIRTPGNAAAGLRRIYAELAELASDAGVQERLKKLPKGVLSERDLKKISDWQNLLSTAAHAIQDGQP